MKTLGLYIHIPFCRKKCNYCDFYSLPTDSSKKISSYVSALCSHITRESALYRDYTVDTVFFGGGTPSLLSNDDFSEIFKALRESFRLATDAEISGIGRGYMLELATKAMLYDKGLGVRQAAAAKVADAPKVQAPNGSGPADGDGARLKAARAHLNKNPNSTEALAALFDAM